MFARLSRGFGVIVIATHLAVIAGCERDADSLRVQGVVVESTHVIGSYFLRGGYLVLDGQKPLPGATAYIAQTADVETALVGFESVTDKDGYYRIRVGSLPAATDEHGQYMLVVKKAGYETARTKITVGVLGDYMKNTVIMLKQQRPQR